VSPPACLEALHKTQINKRTRSKKEKNKKKKLEKETKSNEADWIVIYNFLHLRGLLFANSLLFRLF